MRIDLLQKRKAFEDEFCQALSRYLKWSRGWNGKIDWGLTTFNSLHPNCMLVLTKINVIASPFLDKVRIVDQGIEYTYHQNFLRSFFQSLYVKNIELLSRLFFLKIKTLNIEPWHEYFDNIIIIPGNQSIRILDFEQERSFVIPYLKPSKFIENEIVVRQLYSTDLSLIGNFQVEPSAGGFSENIVYGIPINRLRNNELVSTILTKAKAQLHNLYLKSFEWIPKEQYLSCLVNALNDYSIKTSEILGDQLAIEIAQIQTKALKTLAHEMPSDVPTSITHGDFQLGNILVKRHNRNEFYIIDWEYSRRRMIYFDAMVQYSNSRFPKQFFTKIEQLKSKQDELNRVIGWAFMDPQLRINWKWVTNLFYLEELILRLDEIVRSKYIPHSFKILISQLILLKNI
jgi:thiamine kinase-like enzyme